MTECRGSATWSCLGARTRPRRATRTVKVILVGVFGIQALHAGADDDFDVEGKAPVADVPEIMLHAPAHEIDFGRLAPQSVHLRPAGDPRFDMLAHGVVGDHLG